MSEKPIHKPPTPDHLLQFARTMRTFSTDAEKRLWRVLRDRRLAGFKFRRQAPIGNYIIDFFCHDQNLAVEADGGQHADPTHVAYDARRTNFLAQQGIRVIRFWDHQVLKETDVIKQMIYRALTEGEATSNCEGESTNNPPHPNPLPKGEGARARPPLTPSPSGRGLG